MRPQVMFQSLLPLLLLPMSKLSQSWGDTKLTPPRQASIDYFLLRFIICCAIAFAILDNGFFMDFIAALYVPLCIPISCIVYLTLFPDALPMLFLIDHTSSLSILLLKLL